MTIFRNEHIMTLILETKDQPDETVEIGNAVIAPLVDPDYWTFRVVVSQDPFQAVVGFPKFSTIGIGFAVEDDDWNTNFPYTVETDKIVDHIWRNRLPLDLARDTVHEAVLLIQTAAIATLGYR